MCEREAPEKSVAGGPGETIELTETLSPDRSPTADLVNGSASASPKSFNSSERSSKRFSISKASFRSLWSCQTCRRCRLATSLLLEGLLLAALALTLVILLYENGIGAGDDLRALRADVRAMRADLAPTDSDNGGEAAREAEAHKSLNQLCANLSALDTLLADCSGGRERALVLLEPLESPSQVMKGKEIHSPDCFLQLAAARYVISSRNTL